MFKRIFRGLIRLVIVALMVAGGLVVYFRYLSNFRAQVLDAVQARVANFQIHELSYGEIPVMYRNAVIATEDRRFSWDPGVDPVGIVRSLIVDVQKDGYVEGGSTITQQVVDNTLIQRQKSLSYKLQQAFYAIGIYDTFSKERTFAMYANMIYFGQGAYGLYNAAQTYFGKVPQELSAGELTLLAGLPNAPSTYDPFHNFALARQRQAVVLQNMVDAQVITKGQAAQFYREPIVLK